MKGYLQRLVRTVTNPTESVHPWTGSIFAAAHRGDFNGVQTEELAPAAPVRQSLEVMYRDQAQYAQPSIPTESPSPDDEHNSPTSESQTTFIAAGFLQAKRSADHGPSINERIVFEPLISYIERSSLDSADATELEMTPAQESETGLPLRGRRSLAGADLAMSDTRRALRGEAIIKLRNTPRLAVVSSPAPQAKTDARAVGSHVAGDQRTDEIQIHIGRIEVTAIHPPARTVPKVHNKEISLDAYLKRRDGRAG